MAPRLASTNKRSKLLGVHYETQVFRHLVIEDAARNMSGVVSPIDCATARLLRGLKHGLNHLACRAFSPKRLLGIQML